MCRLLPTIAFLLPILALSLSAQQQSASTSYYPDIVYPGENVITISNSGGIEQIRFRATPQLQVTVPSVADCPRSVDVRVRVLDATTSESVQFTVYDCSGAFSTRTIQSENWTIRHEQTGGVEVGTDTCLVCEIRTTTVKIVDSIVVGRPDMVVKMPPGGNPWRVDAASRFNYSVCFSPDKVESFQETIRLYIRRNAPNGGLTQYVIEKPISATAVPASPPKEDTLRDPLPKLPPLNDPTTFRNIIMPTAEPVEQGKGFVGSYDVAGLTGGYGVTDDFTLIAGGAFVPDFIEALRLGSIGGRYQVLHTGDLRAAIGFQYAYSSTEESDISVIAPYGVVSYGDRAARFSIAAGYTWKHHITSFEEFDRRAYVLALGGDVTLSRGWKLAAEGYVLETSGLAPVAATLRWFNDHMAVDAGLVVDFAGSSSIRSTGALSGELDRLPLAPLVSLLWVF